MEDTNFVNNPYFDYLQSNLSKFHFYDLSSLRKKLQIKYPTSKIRHYYMVTFISNSDIEVNNSVNQ